jgi:hypothetical protein
MIIGYMKIILTFWMMLAFTGFSCRKKNNCNLVTITQSGTPCSIWGIKVNGNLYPSGNIPVSYQQEGRVACATYTLYEDLRLCICCGGTWANIISIKNP